jgi:carboxylesterase type B
MSVGSHLISNDGDNEGLIEPRFSNRAVLQWTHTTAQITTNPSTTPSYPRESAQKHTIPWNASNMFLTLIYTTPSRDIGSNVYRFGYMPIIDGKFLRKWPHTAMISGRSANGHVTDEGSAFCPTNLNTTAEMHDYLLYNGQYKLKIATVNRLLELYPNNPVLSSSFNDVNSTANPGYGAQFKRIAAMLGDYLLIAPHRFNAETSVAQNHSVWSYRSHIALPTTPPAFGIPHASAIPFVFAIPNANYTEEMNRTSQFMARGWVAFTHDLDPAGVELEGFPKWLRYNEGPVNVKFGEKVGLEDALYREEGIKFINQHLLEFVA